MAAAVARLRRVATWLLVLAFAALVAAGGYYMRVHSMPAPFEPTHISIQATRIPFNPESPNQISFGLLHLWGHFELTSDFEAFGGISGLRKMPDGGFVAVTDSGNWLTFDLDFRAEDGQVISNAFMTPLYSEGGDYVSGKAADAEALALERDGSLLVSFERNHRVWRFSGPHSHERQAIQSLLPEALTSRLDDQPSNGGLEAIERLADGRLLLISEELSADDHWSNRKIWLLDGSSYHELTIIVPDGHSPVDAAQMPNGDILFIQRKYRAGEGNTLFVSQIELVELERATRLDRPVWTSLASIQSSNMATDNFEALAVEDIGDDKIRVYLMSDDNFNPLQRTLLTVADVNLKALSGMQRHHSWQDRTGKVVQ